MQHVAKFVLTVNMKVNKLCSTAMRVDKHGLPISTGNTTCLNIKEFFDEHFVSGEGIFQMYYDCKQHVI